MSSASTENYKLVNSSSERAETAALSRCVCSEPIENIDKLALDKHRSSVAASPLCIHISNSSAAMGGPLVSRQVAANHNQARSAYWEVHSQLQRQESYWRCQEVDEETELAETTHCYHRSRQATTISSGHKEGSVSQSSVSAACASSPQPCDHTYNQRSPANSPLHSDAMQYSTSAKTVSRTRAIRHEDTSTSIAATTSSTAKTRDRIMTMKKTVTRKGPLRGDHGVFSKQFTSRITTWKSTTSIKFLEISGTETPTASDNVFQQDEKHHSDSPPSPSFSSGEDSGGESSVMRVDLSASNLYPRKRSLSSVMKEIVEYETVNAPEPISAKQICLSSDSKYSPEFLFPTISSIPKTSIVTNPRHRRRSVEPRRSTTVSSESEVTQHLPAPLPAHMMPQPTKVQPPRQSVSLPSNCTHFGSQDFYYSSYCPQSSSYFSAPRMDSKITTSSVVSCDSDILNLSGSTFTTSAVDDQRPSNHSILASNSRRQKTKRRSSGSRQILESICRTAKRTFGNLRRAMSTDGLNSMDDLPDSPVDWDSGQNQRFPAGLADSDFSCDRVGTTGQFFPHEKKRTPLLHAVNKEKSKRNSTLLYRPSSSSSDCGGQPPVSRSGSYTAGQSRLMDFYSDGTKTVKLVRPESVPFGFFVAKSDQGLYVSRMAVNCSHLNGNIAVGDEILEIGGLSCREMNLEEVHNAIGKRRNVTFRIRPCRLF